MRHSPGFLIASLLLCFAPASTWAQLQLDCSPCTHSFGQTKIGTTKTFSYQLTNTGSTTLKILAQPKKAVPFTFAHLPWKIAPRASVLFTVTYTPTAVVKTKDIILILSSAENSPLPITMQGTGADPTAPKLTISPASLTFGDVTVGSSTALSATLTASNAAVTISSGSSTSSEFSVQGIKMPVTIAAGSSLPITIRFTPNASGVASGKAGFVSNAPNTPTVAQLKGTGVAAGSHSVDLSWSIGSGTAVGYNVYRGTVSGGPYTKINNVLDASTNYLDSSVAAGATYYYATTEVNAEGQESSYSNIAEAVIPSP
jgi:hypothetical protein